MKERVFSFLLALALVTAQMQGIAVAAEAPGDAMTEEAALVEVAAAEEAAVEEASVEEVSVEAAAVEEAAADEEKTEPAEAVEEAAPADDEDAAEAEAPQDPEQDEAAQSFDREDVAGTTGIDEEAPPLETANDPAEAAITAAEVYMMLPEAGRPAASTDANGRLRRVGDGCRREYRIYGQIPRRTDPLHQICT